MKHLFFPSEAGTHVRKQDNVRGDLFQFPDHANIQSSSPPVDVDPDDYAEYVLPPVIPAPTAHFAITKLRLRRKLRETGLEAVLDQFLVASPSALADWNDAMELSTDDPVFSAMIPAFAQAAGIPEAQVMELMRECMD
jgi:hypothetical protein